LYNIVVFIFKCHIREKKEHAGRGEILEAQQAMGGTPVGRGGKFKSHLKNSPTINVAYVD